MKVDDIIVGGKVILSVQKLLQISFLSKEYVNQAVEYFANRVLEVVGVNSFWSYATIEVKNHEGYTLSTFPDFLDSY